MGGRTTLEGAGKLISESKPNAVVLEKSGMDDGDINAQRTRALHSLLENLGVAHQIPKESYPDTEEPRKDDVKKSQGFQN